MEVSFNDWTNRLKVRNEFFKELGEYKVKVAEAELRQATAAGQAVMVRAKQLLIKRLQKELEALARAETRTERETERARAQVKAVSKLLRGRRLSASDFAQARGSFDVVISQVLQQPGTALYEIAVGPTARDPSNFICIRDTREVIAAPAHVDNALELLGWMLDRSQEYIARTGSEAQRAIAQVFQAIEAAGSRYVTAAREALSKMKAGTYDAWDFDKFLASSATGPGAAIAAANTK